MKKTTLQLLSLLTLTLLSTQTIFGQLSTEKIKAIIDNEVANKRSKSIIVGIVDSNGRQIVSAGIKSDKDKQLPDANTIYELGSIGKLFTTLMLAEMSLKNELNYNDPVSKYINKNVKIPSKNGKEISLLHLATHRSGLPRMPYNINPKNLENPMADYTIEQLYECISKIELNREIDSKWQYSNIGYALLGQGLIEASGKDYETLLNQKMTTPLNMKSTMVKVTPELKKNMALPYFIINQPTLNWQNPALLGMGGVSSNMNDMLTFAAANVGLIPTDLAAAMELTHVKQGKKDGNDGFITMGWTILNEDNQQILWKDGATGGYRTFIGIDKKLKYGVVILSNTGLNPVTDIGLHILDSTYDYEPYEYKWNLADTMNWTIKKKGVKAAIELYQQLKSAKNTSIVFNEQQLNIVGNSLRTANRIKDAIKIYELNAQEYPKSSIVYESLGETYNRKGNKTLALSYFQKCLELEPQNPHWAFMVNLVK